MKLRFTAIAALFISTLLFLWTFPAIAANDDALNRLLNTNSCSGCDISGATLSEATLANADLSYANLTGADLTKAMLKSSDLSYANLQGAKLQSADLSNSNLSGTDLSNTQLSGVILSNAELTGANLSNAQLKGARFWGFAGYANLSSANLTGADLQGADLSSIKLLNADLTNADLSNGANLRDAFLNGANLSSANLTQANFVNARLNHANLQAAQLTGTNFRKANLTGADLTGADLRGINLIDAILVDTLGLDPYAEQLFEQATTAANNDDYLGAIAYLQKVPPQTQSSNQAHTKIAEYRGKQKIKEQQQRDAEAAEQLRIADASATAGNYKRAIRILGKVADNTSSYPTAQKSIALYEEKQRLKEQAEQEVKDRQLAAIQAQTQSRASTVSDIQVPIRSGINTESGRSLNSWQPISVKRVGGTLTVTLAEHQVTDEIYKAAITSDICDSVWLEDSNLAGVQEIKILNQFNAQGYVFEGGASACQELRKLSDNDLKFALLGKTHLY